MLLLGVLGGELLGLLHFGVGLGELEAECLGQVGVEANAGELLLGGLGVDARAECHEADGLEVKWARFRVGNKKWCGHFSGS